MGVDIVDVDEGCEESDNAVTCTQLRRATLTHVEVALVVDESLGHPPAVEHIVAQNRGNDG